MVGRFSFSNAHDSIAISASLEQVRPWMQAPLNQKQTPQSVFFSEGVAFDGQRLNRTSATAPFFEYLVPSESAAESLDGGPASPRLRDSLCLARRAEPHVLGTRVSEGYVSR